MLLLFRTCFVLAIDMGEKMLFCCLSYVLQTRVLRLRGKHTATLTIDSVPHLDCLRD